MITRTLLLSLLLAGAGCAHRTYVGASYSDSGRAYTGPVYSSADSDYYSDRYYEPPTSKGAGARALKNETEVYNEPTLYQITTADPAAATTQGAGARALIGQPDTLVMAEPGVEVTTYGTSVGGGEVSGGTSVGSNGSLRPDDANFVRDAMQAGVAEVRMGELAQQKAENSSLRSFGQTLVSDHQQANQELQSLASQKQLTTTMSMSSKDQAMIDKLSSLEGRDFDRACERDAVQAHEKAIKLFKHEAERGQDPDLRAFAQKTLPTLERHLEQAKDLKSSKSST